MPTPYELRVQKNLSQRQLAKLAGVSTPTISRMENGHNILEDKFNGICQALGVSPREVTGVNVYSAVQARAVAKRKKASA